MIPEKKWQFTNLCELHKSANETLRLAMIHERSKKWSKVAESYQKLLWMINIRHFPAEYEPPGTYNMLLYELHYHLGVALQHLGDGKRACQEYTKAIVAISISKGTCVADCVQSSCLMTPMHCRRAFAYCQIDKKNEALRDAERAVVLDSGNSDVFCVRALVRGSRDERALALKDTDLALKANPNHICAIMIRDALTRPPTEQGNMESFHTVTSFNHPRIMEFFDRFFFSLNVPHSITDINLTPNKPNKNQIENPEYNRSSMSGSSNVKMSPKPFRCGTSYSTHSKLSTRRRLDYGEAVRKHVARPKTSMEYYLALVAKVRKRDQTSAIQGRTTSNSCCDASVSMFQDESCSSQDNLSTRSPDARSHSIRDTASRSPGNQLHPNKSHEQQTRTVHDGPRRNSDNRTRTAQAGLSPRIPDVRIHPAKTSYDASTRTAQTQNSWSPRSTDGQAHQVRAVASNGSSYQSQTDQNRPNKDSDTLIRTGAHGSSGRLSASQTRSDQDSLSPRNTDLLNCHIHECSSKTSSTWVQPVDHSISTCSSFWSHPIPASQTRVVQGGSRLGSGTQTRTSVGSGARTGTAPTSGRSKHSKAEHTAQTSNISESGRRTRTFTTKTFTIEAPKNYTLPVFVTSNRKNAPRMYYKPWIGDKLPVAEVIHPKRKPAFY
ncbi:uncharacterized protein LOC121368424 [Gigantopelta aegis]|uniref:uncharacterized protein LOC121368424 n=1 Tax=Gigantopelta aegis TaxID=1735272 RepID=UPI001B8892F6|nr:uncharacterized protein LOC121368424 [Gigantopelta aegis]